MKILVIDDDAKTRDALHVGIELQWASAEVIEAADGEAGVEAFFEHEPDVVLLDVGLPLKSGFEVLKEIRRVSDTPVLLLTGQSEETDQVRGLELGADDYVVKPFGHLALLARMRAVLRRAEMPPPLKALPDFEAGGLTLRYQDNEVRVDSEVVKLTPVEYKVLYHLTRNAGHLLTREALLDRVWGADYDASPEYLKVYMSRLRAKIEKPDGPHYIETERGRGYRFVRPKRAEALPG